MNLNNRDLSLSYEEVVNALAGLIGLPPQNKSETPKKTVSKVPEPPQYVDIYGQPYYYGHELTVPEQYQNQSQQQQKVTEQLNKVHDSLVKSEEKLDMTNNVPCVLSCTYDAFGNIFYKNENGQLHNPNDFAVYLHESDTFEYYLNDAKYDYIQWLEQSQKQIRLSELQKKIQEKNLELRNLLSELEKLK